MSQFQRRMCGDLGSVGFAFETSDFLGGGSTPKVVSVKDLLIIGPGTTPRLMKALAEALPTARGSVADGGITHHPGNEGENYITVVMNQLQN